jgi:hypothetical protein
MLTKMKKEDVIAIGSRYRAGYLLEQHGYTLGLARLDGEPLASQLPAGYLDEVAACAEAVSAARKDKALAASESKVSTRTVNDVMRQAKEWRRKMTARCKKAAIMGHDVPGELLSRNGAKTVPAVTARVDTMVKLLEANRDALPGTDLRPDIEEGQEIVLNLQSTDAAQELHILKHLSDAVAGFYHQKGLLFIGLKAINEAGHELHYRSPGNAAKYNMSILYRSAGRRKQSQDEASVK